jgi:hypothetical protein
VSGKPVSKHYPWISATMDLIQMVKKFAETDEKSAGWGQKMRRKLTGKYIRSRWKDALTLQDYTGHSSTISRRRNPPESYPKKQTTQWIA